MEKTPNAAVVALEAGWSDVGSWAALQDVLEKDPDGNVLRGDVISEGCRNCYIAAAEGFRCHYLGPDLPAREILADLRRPNTVPENFGDD